jgi:hypothetical protein
LIGKNYAGYGEIQNENFLHLLENFANVTQPGKPIKGQIWFDSGTKKLKFFDNDPVNGGKWRTTGGAEVAPGNEAPTGLTTGDFWFNTTTKQLFAWDGVGNEFVLVGPQAAANAGTTQMRSRSVLDTGGQAHAIIEAISNNTTIFVISNDAFTLGTGLGNTIAGYDDIKRGVTLAYTQNGTDGVSSGNYRYYGTATNAEKLGGFAATDFVRSANGSFGSQVHFSNLGYTVGDSQAGFLKVFVESGNSPIISNDENDLIAFRTRTNGAGPTLYPLTLRGSNVLPGGQSASAYASNDTNDLGSSTYKWKTVYATTFEGTATQADKIKVEGQGYHYATIDSEANGTGYSIAARDVNGDLNARKFKGVCTQAYYADLAEIYATDTEYAVGTVIMIGGEKEATAAQPSNRAIGVISEKPAYLMNSEAEGQPVALKGRVPVFVAGPVKKGERLIAGENGVAVATAHAHVDMFGIALESSDDEGIKLVEAIIL